MYGVMVTPTDAPAEATSLRTGERHFRSCEVCYDVSMVIEHHARDAGFRCVRSEPNCLPVRLWQFISPLVVEQPGLVRF